MVLDKETLWILKKLSEREVSVESADRILRALKLLNESEERTAEQIVAVETPQETQETTPAAQEQETVDIEEIPEAPQETEDEKPRDSVCPEPADEIQLMGDDGIAVIEDIPDEAELAVEKAGNITIQGWDEPYLRIEGEKNSSTMRLAGNLMSVRCDSDITFYVPLSIKKISFAAGSGLVDIENCPDNTVIDNDNRDINVRHARGNVKISSNRGNITVKVPPDFGCELIARGSREHMYIELPVEVMEKDKNLLRGTLNGGGATLEILAPDGEIRLQIMELPDEQPSMADVVSNSGISQSNG